MTVEETCVPDSLIHSILFGKAYNTPVILWNKARSADVVRFESRKGPVLV